MIRIAFAIKAWLLLVTTSHAGFILLENIGTDEIEIPAFPAHYGVLERVALEVTMHGITIPQGPGHNHGTIRIRSENSLVDPKLFSRRLNFSLPADSHRHTATRSFSGNGITLHGFNFNTSFSDSHAHDLLIVQDGLERDLNGEYFSYATITTEAAESGGHSIAEDTNSYVFRKALGNVDPFVGSGFITIEVGNVSLSSDGDHSHTFPAFQIPFEDGSAWQFGASTASPAGVHTHIVDPIFDVHVGYTFSSVPEPSMSNCILALMTAGISRIRFRRL